MRQPDAAAYLGVSTRWLRKSSCPKVLLPSNHVGGKPLVRYRQSDLDRWIEQRKLTLQRAG